MTEDPVRFSATVAQVKTLADNGLRVTLDLGEDTIIQAAWLMECKRQGVTLQVRVKADNPDNR